MILVLVYVASVVAFYVFSRYRFPIVFALIGLAAHGASTLWRDIIEGDRRRVARLRRTGPGLWPRLPRKRNDEAGDLSQRFYNLSASFLNDGHLAEAESFARAAAAEGPATSFHI